MKNTSTHNVTKDDSNNTSQITSQTDNKKPEKISPEQVQQIIKEATFSNNYIFQKVLKKIPICEKFLKILLHKDIKLGKVKYEQAFFTNEKTKGIRLDVVAHSKTDGTIYDIEMQKYTSKELLLRAIYYTEVLNSQNLEKGEDYTKIPESYVIFICLHDPFDHGDSVYKVISVLDNYRDDVLETKRNIIYYNCSAFDKIKNDTEQKALLEYISNDQPTSDFTKRLQKEVESVKQSEGLKKMIISKDSYDNDLINRIKEKTTVNCLEKNMSDKDIIDIAEITQEQLDQIKEDYRNKNK